MIFFQREKIVYYLIFYLTQLSLFFCARKILIGHKIFFIDILSGVNIRRVHKHTQIDSLEFQVLFWNFKSYNYICIGKFRGLIHIYKSFHPLSSICFTLSNSNVFYFLCKEGCGKNKEKSLKN